MQWVKGSARWLLVTAGIIVITALGVDATQYLTGSQSALGLLTQDVLEGGCPAEMVKITRSSGTFCIDRYELSVGESCPVSEPTRALETKRNLEQADCQVHSGGPARPWTSVTYLQAKELCARRDMRLPTNAEWYEAALGTSDNNCNIDSQVVTETGAYAECRSARGVHDTVGNVWEWIEGSVTDGTYEERKLPAEGYVYEVDVNGVATHTTTTPQQLMNEDYFWSEADGAYAMMRGGFYGSGADAGVYAVHAKVTPTFSGPAIGFRCVLDL